MIKIEVLNKDYPARAMIEALGYLPQFLDDRNPASAREQLHANYAHGGGWVAFKGFTYNPTNHSIKYPGDPAYSPLARLTLREEAVYIYPHAWVAIVQKDGSCEIARMD